MSDSSRISPLRMAWAALAILLQAVLLFGGCVLLAVTIWSGICTAEPHIVDADEWNTTVKNLVDGNDPRQHTDTPIPIEPASPRFVWGVVGVTGLIGLVFVGLRLWRAKRRAKR